ncbi:exopolysaccharide biosynthesis protein [Brevundimonas sp.]|uniref:exopolysaccharide biosynthesis protein n=1 Tax=Brevundimonas sp. TaxID=1871086 RepID=UPI0025CCEC03|nr:exopolysaccharide biosynthesis protein [Brevundimonas sp.]
MAGNLGTSDRFAKLAALHNRVDASHKRRSAPSQETPLSPSDDPIAQDQFRDDPGQGFIGLIRSLADAAGPEGLTLGEIRDRLDERSFGLMILVLAVPCLVPALYGVPQVVGIPILLLAGQLLMGRHEPWLPDTLLRRRAPRAWLERMAGFAEKRMGWFERLSRPRLKAFACGPGERFAAVFIIVATVAIVLPLMNTVPSIGLALIAVGLIQRDGLFVLGGAVVATLWALAITVVAAGVAYGATWATNLLP